MRISVKVLLAIMVLLLQHLVLMGHEAQPLHKYAEACLIMQRAVALQDKEMLQLAMERMDEIGIDRVDTNEITVSSSKCVAGAGMCYLPEYADYLLLNEFQIAKLDEASLLRETTIESNVSAINGGIAAHSTVEFEILSEGDMEAFLLSDDNSQLDMRIGITSDPAFVAKETDKEEIRWWNWIMPEPGRMVISVTNRGDRDINFVIGLN